MANPWAEAEVWPFPCAPREDIMGLEEKQTRLSSKPTHSMFFLLFDYVEPRPQEVELPTLWLALFTRSSHLSLCPGHLGYSAFIFKPIPRDGASVALSLAPSTRGEAAHGVRALLC